MYSQSSRSHTRSRTRSRRRYNRMNNSNRPMVAFLLIASFGILFAGCGGSESEISTTGTDEYVFTEEDLEKAKELMNDANEDSELDGEENQFVPRLENQVGSASGEYVVDLGLISTYESIRSGTSKSDKNIYKVTNTFLNVRAAPSVTAETVTQLDQGDSIELLDFQDNAWAKVRLEDGTEAFVSKRYIGKVVSEQQLAAEKYAFNGLYFVDFGFLNVRSSPDTDSDKIGELPGQAIVRPLSIDDVWARVMIDGKEGYVAQEYLTPFTPNFLVRQGSYVLPIVQYEFDKEGTDTLLLQQIDELEAAGFTIISLRSFYELLLEQERRDVRLDPKTIVLAITDVNEDNVKNVSDTLTVTNVPITIFLSTKNVGIDAITEKQVLTLMANGADIQSAGHTGDDLRSLTDAQLELELKQSRKILEDTTNKTVFAIGYPLGAVNQRVEDATKASGYLLGVTTSTAYVFTRDQLLRVPSIIADTTMSPGDLAAELIEEEDLDEDDDAEDDDE